ncbi:RNA 3'-terminal phosphate cyclase [Lujinxingia litoralis]|uniref:RNA 3'-terminal phosphate cyclase n=1 Tax=Lujinxingia litoralis TaxID=2211119 RepID=A0A328C403_9DELT|nr:RNA 3'-terminal phosphate cyclase [Lujinxingia litoralis]RAL21124.1 RNA 3'-terminal phosphate cyclase [Lujinxingia litoralis]
MSEQYLQLDGAHGEGGGQLLRSALTLSMLCGRPFEMVNIRAGRRRPGLLRQHLTCVKAAQAICQARVEGAEMHSSSLRFVPGEVRGGDYRFAVGSAGSAMLVFQTVALPLALAAESSTLRLSGGTHNPAAPPYEFIERTYLPLLRRVGLRLEATLLRPGYMPAGGGEMEVRIQPSEERYALALHARGALLSAEVEAQVAHLPGSIAERELSAFAELAPPLPDDELRWQAHHRSTRQSSGPGNMLLATLSYEQVTEVFSCPGQKGLSAERVAERVAAEVRRYLSHDAPAGEHLSDQLLVVLAALGEGSFRTAELSSHARSQLAMLPRFIDREFRLSERADGTIEVALEAR